MLVVRAALLEADHDGVHAALKHLGSEARDGVRLVYRSGYAQRVGRLEHGVADVSPGADNRVWLEFADNLLGLAGAGDHVFEGVQIVLDVCRKEPLRFGQRTGRV